MGASNVSLKLIPKQGSGAQPLTFGLCGPMGAMARLWGVIYFWVLGEHVDVNDAPEVDTDGKLALTLHALDIAIFDDTMYRKGVNLTQMQQRGATVFTPTRVIWLREQDFGTDGKVHAAMPVYGFLQSVAQRAPTVEARNQGSNQGTGHRANSRANWLSSGADPLLTRIQKSGFLDSG